MTKKISILIMILSTIQILSMHENVFDVSCSDCNYKIGDEDAIVQNESIEQSTMFTKEEFDKAFWVSMRPDVTFSESNLQRFIPSMLADPLFVDKNHLATAAYFNKIPVVQLLLDCGVDINVQGCNCSTALYEAIDSSNFSGNQMLQLLLNRGADREMISWRGTPIFKAIDEGNEKAMELLILYGANIEARNPLGDTPVFRAVNESQSECLRILIDNNANLYALDRSGNTPLHAAFGYWHRLSHNVIEQLLGAGLSINIRNKEGGTVLHTGTQALGAIENVKFAIKKGADVNITDKNGRTPLVYAIMRHHFRDKYESRCFEEYPASLSCINFLMEQTTNTDDVADYGFSADSILGKKYFQWRESVKKLKIANTDELSKK